MIGVFASIAHDVRVVNTGIGADESEFVLDYDHALALTDDLVAFTEHQFHKARIFFGLRAEFNGALRCGHIRKVDQTPFGFADDLLRKHKNVVVLQFQFRSAQGVKNNIRQVVALADEGDILKRG